MPTHKTWLENDIIQITWNQPLTSNDLLQCFLDLTETIDSAEQRIHILFDLVDAGSIPVDAPVLAIRSRFMIMSNTGRIAVTGSNALPKMLADVAARITKKEIVFFHDQESALNYLHEADN